MAASDPVQPAGFRRDHPRIWSYQPLIIEDKSELLALHKTIFLAKFSDPPILSEIALSPIIAKLANQLVAELAEGPAPEGGETWQEWRKAENHKHLFEVLLKSLIRNGDWPSISGDTKRERVATGLAPLLADEETVNELIGQADQKAAP